MYSDPLQENLVEESTRLIGRPVPVVRDAISHMLRTVVLDIDADVVDQLSPFPMTAWQAIAPDNREVRQLWSAVLTVGLTPDEVFTLLALVDDYVRRAYGDQAWGRVQNWGPSLAREYQFDLDPASVTSPNLFGAGL